MLLPKTHNDAFEFIKEMYKILLVFFWDTMYNFASWGSSSEHHYLSRPDPNQPIPSSNIVNPLIPMQSTDWPKSRVRLRDFGVLFRLKSFVARNSLFPRSCATSLSHNDLTHQPLKALPRRDINRTNDIVQ